MKKKIRISESNLIQLIQNIISEVAAASEDPNLGEPIIGDDNKETKDFDKSPDNVICIQNAILRAGLGSILGKGGPKKDGVDGIYGSLTIKAVKLYQEKFNISNPGTGFVGPKTAKHMGCKRLPTRKESSSVPQKTQETSKKEIVKKIEKVYDDKVPPSKVTKEPNTYLFFDGNYLNWVSNSQTVRKWPAKSGRQVTQGKLTDYQKSLVFGYDRAPEDVSKSNIEYSKVKSAGNIPQGNYSLGVMQTRSGSKASDLLNNINDIWKIYKLRFDNEKYGHDWNTGTIPDKIAWGDYRIPIIKSKGTETYGRGSFYIHGGAIPGSIGCIDLSTNMDDFAKYFSTWQVRTGIKNMPLVVKYT